MTSGKASVAEKENKLDAIRDGITPDPGGGGRENWMKYAILVLGIQWLATLALSGVKVNLVLFLTRVLGKDKPDAAELVGLWDGFLCLCSVISIFLADFFGAVNICAISQIIFVIGLGLLGTSSFLFTELGSQSMKCTALFYTAMALVAVGYGGYEPNISACWEVDKLIDEEDSDDSRERKGKPNVAWFRFFYYLTSNRGSLISSTLSAYFEDQGNWTLGFVASVIFAFAASVIFVAGRRSFLANTWRLETERRTLCTVMQLDRRMKSKLFRVLKIWGCTICYPVVLTQTGSLFVEQGASMRTNYSILKIPPASISIFQILAVTISLFFHVFLGPIFSELQRMGIGLLLATGAMLCAGAVEWLRILSTMNNGSITIFWQVPQYVFMGLSEVFMGVGQFKFFNRQVPRGLTSFGKALSCSAMSFGSFTSSALVKIVVKIAAADDVPFWFYFILAGFTSAALIAYVVCATGDKHCQYQFDEELSITTTSCGKEV